MLEKILGKKNLVAVGFGVNPEEALRNAEERLPFPIKQQEKYTALTVGDPRSVEGGHYKVEVQYALAEKQTAPQQQWMERLERLERKASSYGPMDPFAGTR